VDELRPEITITLARPLHDAARVTRLLTAKLDQVDPGFGIETVILTADPIAHAPRTQSSTESEAASPLPALIDDLANRLTPNQIWRPAPQASHIPERASIAAPPLSTPSKFPKPPGPRPLRLLRPPEPIEATAPIPDDPPLQFRWRGALHRVRAATGPERIAAEWWRRSAEIPGFRDYYQVEDFQGARFWLFRTGLPGETATAWYLHGLFG
jgi:protein ImuB